MKYVLRDDIQVDCFSDGEMVVYDQISEVTHVLNITAAMILNIITSDEEAPFDSFVKTVRNNCPDAPIKKLKEDFQNIVSRFLESNIIIKR